MHLYFLIISFVLLWLMMPEEVSINSTNHTKQIR